MKGRRAETMATEKWRVRLYRAGQQVHVDASPAFRTREAAAHWARTDKRAEFLDVQLWCRPAGSSRYEATDIGWSAEVPERILRKYMEKECEA